MFYLTKLASLNFFSKINLPLKDIPIIIGTSAKFMLFGGSTLEHLHSGKAQLVESQIFDFVLSMSVIAVEVHELIIRINLNNCKKVEYFILNSV